MAKIGDDLIQGMENAVAHARDTEIQPIISDYAYAEADDEIYYVPNQKEICIPGRPRDVMITHRLTVPEVLEVLRSRKRELFAETEHSGSVQTSLNEDN